MDSYSSTLLQFFTYKMFDDYINTNCGIFAWHNMPFGLKNAGSTFQRTMRFIFNDLERQNLIISLEDLNNVARTFKLGALSFVEVLMEIQYCFNFTCCI